MLSRTLEKQLNSIKSTNYNEVDFILHHPSKNSPIVKRKHEEGKDAIAENLTKLSISDTKKFVYMCNECKKKLKDNPKQFRTMCIACNICDMWYHLICVGIKKGSEPEKNDWICENCSKM